MEISVVFGVINVIWQSPVVQPYMIKFDDNGDDEQGGIHDLLSTFDFVFSCTGCFPNIQ